MCRLRPDVWPIAWSPGSADWPSSRRSGRAHVRSKGGPEFFGERVDRIRPPVQLGGSVLEGSGAPTVALASTDQHLNGMAIRHDVVAARGHHPYDGMQQLGALVQAPDAPNDTNISCDFVIAEDRGELLTNGLAPVHLAAVEADDERVVGEAAGIGLGVPPVPRPEDVGVQGLEVGC